MFRKFVRSPLLPLVAVALFAVSSFANTSQGGLWTRVDDSGLGFRTGVVNRTAVPDEYSAFRLDRGALASLLASAPDEAARAEAPIIELPMPDGRFAKFQFERSTIVEPGLLAKYPELGQTFRAFGVDDPTATVRFDFLPTGFHAMILTTSGTVIIDPYAKGELDNYVAFKKDDLQKAEFKCQVDGDEFDSLIDAETLRNRILAGDATQTSSGTTLRTYRLALAATNEYAVAVGNNTIAGTLAAQVAAMNRVNGVYERDLAIRMILIADNDKIIYAADQMCNGAPCNSGNDPYTNSSGTTMLTENSSTLNQVIGSANFDIGHVFSTGGGGVATLNAPCGGNKARGVTGLGSAALLQGDSFYIDYVAHEMGHQFGGQHTFNGTVGSCGGTNRSAGAAYEVGSGITIMAYAGICGNQDLARNSIDTFHVKSLEQINAFVTQGNGATCGVATPTGNTPPNVSIAGGTTFDVPKQTPFTLTASGSDPDGDAVTYDWQEYDLGAGASAVPNTDAGGAMPVFRPYLPSTSPVRTFPSSQYQLANANVPPSTFGSCPQSNCLVGELMPQIGRTMNFQVVARDNRSGGGGFNTATATVNVDGNAGPFAITGLNTTGTYAAGTTQTLTWSTNGTQGPCGTGAGQNASPACADNVKISFSTDGGLTFPTVLAASTPNDGSQDITIPFLASTRGRIKIEAIGKIYFDVSDVNFTSTVSAQVAVSGKVTSPTGTALRDVKVSLYDPFGVRVMTATTSSFGEFTMGNVPGGVTYTMTATSKRYRFSPRQAVVGVSALTGVDFVGLQ